MWARLFDAEPPAEVPPRQSTARRMYRFVQLVCALFICLIGSSTPILLLAAETDVTAATKPAGARAISAEDLEFFEKKIRPLLAANCFECHGEKKQEAGLRL